MKITILQTALRPERVGDMLRAADRLVASAPASSLYVLPEMWVTGFTTAPTASTAAAGLAALEWMRETARRTSAAVAGSLAVADEAAAGKWRNRFFFVRPDGSEEFYDKQHLFAYGGEDRCFLPGAAPVTVEWEGRRIRLQTCFDLRFPETARNFRAAPYDLLLYAAGWPSSRQRVWHALLAARALENQAYCVGVNCAGWSTDEKDVPRSEFYRGGSSVVSPYGDVIAELDAAEQSFTFEPDFERMEHLREKFPVLE
ncbi:MAG: nitrilase-related carbon-nitrogen hydrolase [Alloprevotella sp.]